MRKTIYKKGERQPTMTFNEKVLKYEFDKAVNADEGVASMNKHYAEGRRPPMTVERKAYLIDAIMKGKE